MVILDSAPEPPGALTLTALGRYTREDADAEDAAGTIAELVGDRKRLARTRLALFDEPRIQGKARQLRQRSSLPPRHFRFAR